ncbi:hypothetical protein PIB30_074787, partial [Stylosanthes scabra]|nr:hypothetical protein [Stylosanthes scabra]
DTTLANKKFVTWNCHIVRKRQGRKPPVTTFPPVTSLCSTSFIPNPKCHHQLYHPNAQAQQYHNTHSKKQPTSRASHVPILSLLSPPPSCSPSNSRKKSNITYMVPSTTNIVSLYHSFPVRREKHSHSYGF